MKKNLRVLDSNIRTIITLVAGFLVYLGIVVGVTSFVLLTVSVIFVVTSLVRVCPLYGLFRFNICNTKEINKL